MNIPDKIQKRIDISDVNCWNELPDGWVNLVLELDEKLSKIHPDYALMQVKEKFGGLRYYVSGVNSEEAISLIDEYEAQSFKVCQECSKPGERKSKNGWLRTLCPKHAKEYLEPVDVH